MLSTLNELTLQKELQNFVTNNVFWTKKVKTTKHKFKQKSSCQSRELHPGPMAQQSDALPLDH